MFREFECSTHTLRRNYLSISKKENEGVGEGVEYLSVMDMMSIDSRSVLTW